MAEQDKVNLSKEVVDERILLIRGQRVMLDADLADLYEIPTKALNQAVKRNQDRFPPDFMFQLSREERDELVTICDQFKNLSIQVYFANHFPRSGKTPPRGV